MYSLPFKSPTEAGGLCRLPAETRCLLHVSKRFLMHVPTTRARVFPLLPRSSQAANGGSWKRSRLTWDLILADCPVTERESGGAYEELRLMKAHTSNSLRQTSAVRPQPQPAPPSPQSKKHSAPVCQLPNAPRTPHFPLTRACSPKKSLLCSEGRCGLRGSEICPQSRCATSKLQ